MGFLDCIFPKYCVICKKIGDYVCSNCFSYLSFDVSLICIVCNLVTFSGFTHKNCKGKYTLDGVFASIKYNIIAQKLLYQFKYKPFVSHLSSFLTDIFYEGIIQNESFMQIYQSKEEKIFVPIPLHVSCFKKRGYNQSKILAIGLSQKLNVPMFEVLTRTKKTIAQFGLKNDKRVENIKNAFSVKKEMQEKIYEKSIFLVDDMLTSGATLSEASRILKKNGAKYVFGLVLARD